MLMLVCHGHHAHARVCGCVRLCLRLCGCGCVRVRGVGVHFPSNCLSTQPSPVLLDAFAQGIKVNSKGKEVPHGVRLYSIAASRYGDTFDGQTTSLCVRRATYWDEELKADDPAKKGICSNFLADAKPGDKILMTGEHDRRGGNCAIAASMLVHRPQLLCGFSWSCMWYMPTADQASCWHHEWKC